MKQILKNYHEYVVLPSNCVPRGDLLSIPMYIISSIFRLLTVTLGLGSMSLKISTLFLSKQHPNVYTRGRPLEPSKLLSTPPRYVAGDVRLGSPSAVFALVRGSVARCEGGRV